MPTAGFASSAKYRKGFTLVELLVVLGITSILVGLLLAPLVTSFTITQRTQLAVRTQAAARDVLEQITREIKASIFVYDNTRSMLRIPLGDPTDAGSQSFLIPHAMVDLVGPKTVMYCNFPGHPPQQPRTYSPRDAEGMLLAQRVCPFDGSDDVEQRPVTPTAADTMIVRYFIGLRDPSKPYSNANEDAFAIGGQVDNTFVLYRAEYNPADSRFTADPRDPNFFYGPDRDLWVRLSHVVGPSKDINLIAWDLDSNGNPEGAIPSIKFVPNVVRNDVLTPTDLGRVREGEPNSIPTVYRATSGQWSPDFQVRLYRNINGGSESEVYYTDYNGSDLVIRKAGASGIIFNITNFEQSGVISPNNPELMFTVDPNKGQVSFEMPFTPDVLTSEDIVNINQQFVADHESGAPAVRSVLPAEFQALESSRPDAKIVPGSDRIIGPDWTPGENYGKAVLYSRVSLLTDDPGLNQYKINYDTGEITFYSQLTPPMPSTLWDGQSPADPIEISYSVQNNRGFDRANGDILSVDYTTKNVLSVQVAYRAYDDRGKPQQLRLTNNVTVRNFHR